MAAVTESEREDVAYALIVDPGTGQILIVGYPEGGWSLPGGLREPGETLAQTAIRETMEEAGVVIAVERLVAVNERLPDPHAVFFVFRARIVDGTPTVTDDEETDRFKWVDPEEANDLLSHWGMDFCLHDDYGALYHTGQWEDRDWCCRSTRHQSGILDGPSEPVFDWPLSCPVQLIRKSPRECKD